MSLPTRTNFNCFLKEFKFKIRTKEIKTYCLLYMKAAHTAITVLLIRSQYAGAIRTMGQVYHVNDVIV